MKTIVFAGGSSLLAQSWIREEQPEYNFILGVHKREPDQNKGRNVTLAYENPEELAKQFKLLKADIVLNCIGLTNVEACEKDEKQAAYTNVEIAQNIAQASKLSKVKLIHISTDHLFDGAKAFASEQEKKVPVNAYGRTKSQGEDIVLNTHPDSLVIRTNFFGWGPSYKPSFSDQILNSLERNTPIQLFDDVYYTPVSVASLRECILALVEKKAIGIYNVTSSERITKYEFGCQLADSFGYSKNLIEPISIESIPGLTQRPKDMSLSNHKLSVFLSKPIPSLKEQIVALKEEEKKNQERLVIPYGRQDVSQEDIDAVVNVLRSDFITQGPVIQQFE
ncbi:MAG: DegT/DnrJ/EryC1/StrS family aminotransferase, partial [Flavobacteriaceae bacterium]